MSIASFGITRWTKWDSSRNATEYTYMYYSTMQQKILRRIWCSSHQTTATISPDQHTDMALHARGWQSYSSRFSPPTYFHTLCVLVQVIAICPTGKDFCSTRNLWSDLFLSVVGVDLHFSTSWFSFCLQIISAFCFYFSTLDFLPGLWFQDASVECLPLFLWNFFFFLNPLPACLCFFPASHWRAVKHRANFVPQNYFSFTVQTLPSNCCLVLMLHIITSA